MPKPTERVDLALVALRQILRATEHHSRQLAKAAGLTPVQLRVLQIVGEKEDGTTGSEIARRMHVSQATVTALVDRVERGGLVRREPSTTDRRSIGIHLTPTGRTAVASAPEALQQKFAGAFRAMEDWEQAMMVAVLERVAAMMEAPAETNAVLYAGDLPS